ncbi:DNA polymerase III subunit delta' [Desulfolithobacter dissulfuricans]|uniref:DNA polymerase III subunit delta n=1 Tax=Desulfolithobacter dissulfuricans TaxID=2795293 RepID=A0A915TXM6_9BACT|nr:DNA polymerase III subunit delta' [Desulfolithobacter dissulfuricans]BCO07638.1 DNA polymerase III subunit delta' [Desulfolithobacter dissulfuricans]
MPFQEILGQPKAIKLLTRALTTGRLAHAYLFTGPDGVGKAATARAMAAWLFCGAERDLAPCGRCPGCIKFASGNHPDFFHIVPDGMAIKIDQVRSMKKQLSFAPLEARQRVVLLEDVHTMRREAGNSLLKILEEPPPDNLLILVGSDREPILPTIMSRCQVVPFAPLTVDLAAEILVRCDPDLDRSQARVLATLADGCPGLARSLETGGVLDVYRELVEGLFTAPEDPGPRVECALKLAGRAAAGKEGLDLLLDLLEILFQKAMKAHLLGTPAGKLDDQVARAREQWNLTQLSDKVQAMGSARRALARNCNQGLVCEALMLDLLECSPRVLGG